MRFVNALILVLFSFVATETNATESKQVFGGVECSSYNENKNNSNMQFGYKNWWAGYLTGLGVTFEEGKSPEAMPEATNFILSLSSYCNSNPSGTLKGAVDDYIKRKIQAGYAKVTSQAD